MNSWSTITLPAIFECVSGQHCTVLGSAPDRRLPEHYQNTFIVGANGAGIGLSHWLDLHVIGAQVPAAKDRASRHTLRNLNGKYSERVLFVHPGKMTDFEERYQDFGFSWGTSETLTAEQRFELVKSLTGYELPALSGPRGAISNGILSILLTAVSGASRIDISGFSFSPGHFYIGSETVRNHTEQDAMVLMWLRKNTNVHATDAFMQEKFGFPSAK